MESPNRASTGKKIASKDLDTLRDWLFWCYNEKQLFRRLRISMQQREQLLNVTNVLNCIWGKGVETPARVIHHCHLSGTIFGVAQSNCNVRARSKIFYDSSSIIYRDTMLTIYWKSWKWKLMKSSLLLQKQMKLFFFHHQNSCGLLWKSKRATREIAWISSFPAQLSNCLSAWKFLRIYSRQMIFQYSSSFFPTFSIICLSNSHRRVCFPTGISTILKNSKNRFLLMVTLGKTVLLAQLTLLHPPRVWLQEFEKLPRHLF